MSNILLVKETPLYCGDFQVPVRWNVKVFVEQAHKKFGVLFILRTADLSNAGERAERARISFSTEHHHLIRDDVYGNILSHINTKTDKIKQLIIQFFRKKIKYF